MAKLNELAVGMRVRVQGQPGRYAIIQSITNVLNVTYRFTDGGGIATRPASKLTVDALPTGKVMEEQLVIVDEIVDELEVEEAAERRVKVQRTDLRTAAEQRKGITLSPAQVAIRSRLVYPEVTDEVGDEADIAVSGGLTGMFRVRVTAKETIDMGIPTPRFEGVDERGRCFQWVVSPVTHEQGLATLLDSPIAGENERQRRWLRRG